MPQATLQKFTQDHVVSDDGSVGFKCSSDVSQWPWLALHPCDPIVIQTINFHASVEASMARGTFDPKKWSALTQTEWTCGAREGKHAVHGIADALIADDVPRYRLRFFDENDAPVYTMSGTGVVFHNRDFEAWRKKAKRKMAAASEAPEFQYAPAAGVGVATQKESFLAPLVTDGKPRAKALITRENGFTPGHPYISGSGDHVNATHLGEVAKQFATLLRGGKAGMVAGGEMLFKRYVELGRPFAIELAEDGAPDDAVSMMVHQANRLCANLTLRYLP